MSRLHALVALLVLLVPANAWAARIAILEFSGSPTADVRALMTDQARAGVVAAVSGADHLVMTRENMALVARDMGLDLACAETSAECEVDVARNIGAGLVVSGRVSVLEGTHFVTLKLHETERGALLASRTVRAQGAVAVVDALPGATQALVREGLGAGGSRAPTGNEGAIRAPASSLDLGGPDVVVRFESEPAGAVVQLDGRLLCASTPCSKAISPGHHTARFQAEGYRESRQDVATTSGLVVRVELRPTFARVTVETDPPGLEVSADGEKRGSTPLELRLDAGSHAVLIDDACYLPDGERISVDEGAVRTLKLAARARVAGLKVSARDAGGNDLVADVIVDRIGLGQTPFAGEVGVCAQELRVVGLVDGERLEASESLALEEGAVFERTLVFEPRATPKSPSRRRRGSGAAEAPTQGPSPFVIDTIIRNNAAIVRCLRDERDRGADLGTKIYLKFAAAPDGTVTRARVTTSRFAGTRLDTCISREVNALKLPAFSGKSVTISYPIVVQK